MRKTLKKKCPKCGSKHIYFITRVTGYFSKTSMWNVGKLRELLNRHRDTKIK